VLLRDSLTFDLGALAKGFAVDRLAALLDSMGFPAHLVQAGGDMKCTGTKPEGDWNIGIRHPRFPDSVGGSLRVGASAISTSGDYERCFFSGGKRYHHILDPMTGEPARPQASVTILAPTSRVADGLSTTLFILGPGPASTGLLQTHGAEALWIRENPDQSLCAMATEGIRKRLAQFTLPFCPD
jgi:thiamine biosynthesis lipoprotein